MDSMWRRRLAARPRSAVISISTDADGVAALCMIFTQSVLIQPAADIQAGTGHVVRSVQSEPQNAVDYLRDFRPPSQRNTIGSLLQKFLEILASLEARHLRFHR